MGVPDITILASAILSSSSGAIAIGDVMIDETSSGDYVKATAANRGSRRSKGISLQSWSTTLRGAVRLQTGGLVSTAVTGLGAGAVSWVRVSSAGRCERVTPGSGDDLLGKCDALGNLFLQPGTWDSDNYAGGGGGGSVPTGTGFTHITAGAQDAAAKLVENADVHASAAIALSKIVNPTGTGVVKATAGVIDAATSTIVNADVAAGAAIAISKLAAIAASDIASGTLVHERGGLEADVSAYSGLVKITGGATSAVAAPTGAVVGTSDSQTLTNKAIDADTNTITNIENADIKAGAGIAISKLAAIAATDIASGTLIHERGGLEADVSAYDGLVRITGGATSALAVSAAFLTFLATPTTANFLAWVTGETGTGAIVFGTGPTISSALLTGTPSITTFTTNGSTGTLNDVSRSSSAIVEFTHATGPTVNGLDATGAVDGTLCGVYVSGGNVLIAHEDAGSAAANRFTLSSGINITCTTGSITWFIYRTSRWRALTASAI